MITFFSRARRCATRSDRALSIPTVKRGENDCLLVSFALVLLAYDYPEGEKDQHFLGFAISPYSWTW